MLNVNNGATHGPIRTGVLADLAEGFSVLTDGAAVTWDTENKKFPLAKLTSTQSFTIDITNAIDGQSGILKLITDTASAITLTFDTTFTNKRLGAVGEESFTTYIFPAATGKEYILSYILEGTTMHWIINETGLTAWTPTFTGFQTAPTTDAKYIFLAPKVMWFYLTIAPTNTSDGTSASGTSFTLPSGITAAAVLHIPVPRINSNTNLAPPGVAATAAASNVVTVYRDGTFTALWGTAGQSKAFSLQGIIPVS